MPQQVITGHEQINTGTVQRQNIDIVTPNKSVIIRIITGSGISMQSTGADAGTGVVTLSVVPKAVQDIVGAMIGTTTGIQVIYNSFDGIIQYEIEDAYVRDLVGAWVLENSLPRGTMWNGKIFVTGTANDLIVSLKTLGGVDPSASEPAYVRIGNVVREITAATSFTLADGTNWFNAGSAELGTKEIDYFCYLVWDSNSSVVAISASRIPYGNLVSDFSGTTTNEKYLANHANFTSTDEVEVIGRFAATLSLAGTSHLWTVPTFTSANLIQKPIYETRLLTFVSTITPQAGSLSSIVRSEVYQVTGQSFIFDINDNFTTNTSAPAYIQFTMPFTPAKAPGFSGIMSDAAVTSTNVSSSGNSLFVRRYDGAGFTLGAGRAVVMRYNASLVA